MNSATVELHITRNSRFSQYCTLKNFPGHFWILSKQRFYLYLCRYLRLGLVLRLGQGLGLVLELKWFREAKIDQGTFQSTLLMRPQ